MRKPKAMKRGTVRKVIKSLHPRDPEKAEITVHDADDLYKEIRVKNELEDDEGNKVKLKEGADVDVIIEADSSGTTPTDKTQPK
jgi:hypothetical protein